MHKTVSSCNSIYISPPEVSQELIDDFEQRSRAITQADLWHVQDEYEKLDRLADLLPELTDLMERQGTVCTCGRVIRIDDFGKLCFAVLQDGVDLVELKLSPAICQTTLETWKEYVRLGDNVSVCGQVGESREGQPQIRVNRFALLSICGLTANNSGISKDALSPTPNMRRLHVQMLANPTRVAELRVGSTVLAALRSFLTREGFDEQITPLLARSFYAGRSHPFVTHSRSEGTDLYLRVTAEVALKMMLTGGLTKVYEIGPSFRNENQDAHHLAGFTLLEAYAAYTSFEKMLDILEKMLVSVVGEVRDRWGRFELPRGWREGGIEPFRQVSAREALAKAVQIDVEDSEDIARLAQICERDTPHTATDQTNLIYYALKKLVYPTVTQPTYIVDLPAGISPFIQENPRQSGTLKRAFLVYNGLQIAEAFSSCMDAVHLQNAIQQQIGYWDSMSSTVVRDYRDFLHAMFCGMPPVAVMDVGVERLLAVLLGEDDIRRLRIDI